MARRSDIEWTPAIESDTLTDLVHAGDFRGLAAHWEAHGFVYEAADTLADSDDVDDIRRAHERLVGLGSAPGRRWLPAACVSSAPTTCAAEGPRASTRANAAGLTARELEVASLLVGGLTNAEIADRLVVSAKTVDHHVSAVLTKLGVSSRRHVRQAAVDLGLDLTDTVAGR